MPRTSHAGDSEFTLALALVCTRSATAVPLPAISPEAHWVDQGRTISENLGPTAHFYPIQHMQKWGKKRQVQHFCQQQTDTHRAPTVNNV
eukprot:m.846998 g.846998  ORF g.846998 m.846998 type:complete len:90 (+) comp23479_c0_seq1:3218-3487(+)